MHTLARWLCVCVCVCYVVYLDEVNAAKKNKLKVVMSVIAH